MPDPSLEELFESGTEVGEPSPQSAPADKESADLDALFESGTEVPSEDLDALPAPELEAHTGREGGVTRETHPELYEPVGPAPPGAAEAAVAGLTQGASLGFADEVAELLGVDDARERYAEAREVSPFLHDLSLGAGALATLPLTGVARGVRGAAALGALGGVGHSNAESVDDTVRAAAGGGTAGGVLGGLGNLAGLVGRRLTRGLPSISSLPPLRALAEISKPAVGIAGPPVAAHLWGPGAGLAAAGASMALGLRRRPVGGALRLGGAAVRATAAGAGASQRPDPPPQQQVVSMARARRNSIDEADEILRAYARDPQAGAQAHRAAMETDPGYRMMYRRRVSE